MAGIQISVQQKGFPVSFFKGFNIVVLKIVRNLLTFINTMLIMRVYSQNL